MGGTSRLRVHLPLFIIVAATAALYFTSLPAGHRWGGDFAQYIYQAGGISEGKVEEVISNANFRYENSTHSVGPRYYPWGFPLLLSPVYRAFGIDMHAMKAYVCLFFLLSLPVMYALFKDRLAYPQALLLVTVFAVSPLFFHLRDSVLSDLPFLLLSLFTIFLIQRTVVDGKPSSNRYVDYSLIGLFIFLSYYVRSLGISLIAVLFVCQWVHKRISGESVTSYLRSRRFACLPYVVFILLVVLSGLILPAGTGSYLDDLRGTSWRVALVNLYDYSRMPYALFGSSMVSRVIYAVTLPFLILGIARAAKRDYMYLAYAAVTLLLIIPFPYTQGARYVVSLLPFYVYFLFVGLSRVRISSVIPGKRIRPTWSLVHIVSPILILISCIALIGARLAEPEQAPSPPGLTGPAGGPTVVDGPYTAESLAMFDYIRSNTEADDVIVFFKPRVMTLYTDRRSILVSEYDRIVAAGARYIVYSEELGTRYGMDSVIEENRDSLELVFENPRFKIYRTGPSVPIYRDEGT